MSKNDRVPDPHDVHGYIAASRRLIWPLIAALLAVAIAIGIVINHVWSAR